MALYVFPNAVQPSLKGQGIKPHWMFTLDDLIRSAVQQAVNYLNPEANPQMVCVQNNEVPKYGNTVTSPQPQLTTQILASGRLVQTQSLQPHPFLVQSNLTPQPVTVDYVDQKVMDYNQQHRVNSEHIQKLYEELIQVEREYKELLEQNVNEKRRSIERLALNISDGDSGIPADGRSPIECKNEVDLYASLHQNHRLIENLEGEAEEGQDSEEVLTSWLKSLGCDENSIQTLIFQHYTKRDIIDFVTREELIQAGVAGGIACRIWRAVLRLRSDGSHKYDGDQVVRKFPRYRS